VSEAGVETLREQLRADPPAGVAALAEADLQHLAEAVRAARHRQAAELDRAGEQALRLIPRILRGPIRKVVG
jgi:hypothetical protein